MTPVEEYLKEIPDAVRPIVEKLRDAVKLECSSMQEIVAHGALGYSPSGRSFDRIIYILLSKDHVTLGFFFGTSLPDPGNLLVGEGKRMRHVKIRTIDETENPALRRLIKAACTERSHITRKKE